MSIYCDVIGCGRLAFHINVSNPFTPQEKHNFCDRCLRAGQQAVSEGHKELTGSIYAYYYAEGPDAD